MRLNEVVEIRDGLNLLDFLHLLDRSLNLSDGLPLLWEHLVLGNGLARLLSLSLPAPESHGNPRGVSRIGPILNWLDELLQLLLFGVPLVPRCRSLALSSLLHRLLQVLCQYSNASSLDHLVGLDLVRLLVGHLSASHWLRLLLQSA